MQSASGGGRVYEGLSGVGMGMGILCVCVTRGFNLPATRCLIKDFLVGPINNSHQTSSGAQFSHNRISGGFLPLPALANLGELWCVGTWLLRLLFLVLLVPLWWEGNTTQGTRN